MLRRLTAKTPVTSVEPVEPVVEDTTDVVITGRHLKRDVAEVELTQLQESPSPVVVEVPLNDVSSPVQEEKEEEEKPEERHGRGDVRKARRCSSR